MPDLPKKKVGIVACSGEERAEGTVTRLAALRVLEQMRPDDTVTICLPLFLAGGEGDRAFARFYPTIAVDGCDKRCAARATEQFSGKPADGIVVTDLVADGANLGTARRLNDAGSLAAKAVAEVIASRVDELLDKKRSRLTGAAVERAEAEEPGRPSQEEVQEAVEAACSCGSGIPVLTMSVNGRRETLIAVPAIFDQFYQQGKRPGTDGIADQLLETTRLYNPIPEPEVPAYRAALLREFEGYCRKKEA
jgi:uncharacterized metal-binding protein